MKRYIPAAALAAVLMGSSPVLAADFGGDCCADLEERIAELEATTARKGNRKVSLTVYGQVNMAVMWWDDSVERNVYQVNNKTSTSLFGLEGTANINSEWRAGYRIEIETASANSDFVDQGDLGVFIPGVSPPPVPLSNFVIPVGDDGRNGLFLRHSHWWIENKRLGRITIGQQSNATDNIAEMDLSRTSAVSLSSVETWNEGFWLRSTSDGLAVNMPGLTFFGRGLPVSIIGDLWRGNFDGGRGNFVRYDSPLYNGFIFSADWGEDDDFGVALRYAGSFNGISLVGGIGYHDGKTLDTDALTAIVGGTNNVPDHHEIVGSFSVLHEPTGLFLTMAGGQRQFEADSIFTNPNFEFTKEKYLYAKAGILRKFFALGQTSIYGEYYKIWDVGVTLDPALSATFFANSPGFSNSNMSEEANTLGVGIVQHVDAAAMELYLAYRRYWADNITDIGVGAAGTPVAGEVFLTDHNLRMDIVMGGARIKF